MDPKPNAEDRFRDDLLNVVALLHKLTPLAESSADLLTLCELGLENTGQLRLIMLAAGSKTK